VAALKWQMRRSCSAGGAFKASQPSPPRWDAFYSLIVGAFKRCLAPKDILQRSALAIRPSKQAVKEGP